MIPMVLFFTTQGTWDLTKQRDDGGWSGGFFKAQAESMLRQRLDVDPRDIQAECFQRRRRCYGYFGVTPSLVRLPVISVLRTWQSAATPLFLAIAVLLAYGAALRLVQRGIDGAPGDPPSRGLALGYAALAAAALGPGSVLLFVVRPAVFEEAAAWGVAFLLLALNHVWSWSARTARSLIPAVLFGVAAANARPTAATACGVLGVFAAAWCWKHGLARRHVVAAWCLCLLPGLTASGVFWLKLRTPIPSIAMNRQVQEAPHWKAILERTGGRTGGLIFLPTALTAYLRPDAVTRQKEWPYFDFRFPTEPIQWVPPLPRDGAYVEPVASLTSTMPWPFIVTMLVALALARRFGRMLVPPADRERDRQRPAQEARDAWLPAIGIFVGAVATITLTVTTVGITSRYLADFYPTVVVGVAIGSRIVLPALAGRPRLVFFAGCASLLMVAWSLVVVSSLATRLVFD